MEGAEALTFLEARHPSCLMIGSDRLVAVGWSQAIDVCEPRVFLEKNELMVCI